MIFSADTIIYPRTVMIIPVYTYTAYRAVARSRCFNKLTIRTQENWIELLKKILISLNAKITIN